MMVRWMFGVSLKDRKRSVDLQSFGIESVAEVVRRGRFNLHVDILKTLSDI